MNIIVSHGHLPFITHLTQFFHWDSLFYCTCFVWSGSRVCRRNGWISFRSDKISFGETSVSITAGTNLGVSTLGAITADNTPLSSKKYTVSCVCFFGYNWCCRSIYWLILNKLCSYSCFASDNWFNRLIRIICIT